ncbi:MAG: hypothetical protein WC455_18860 [Dehalococcoidia bacterium]|jgi:hypothetical protein
MRKEYKMTQAQLDTLLDMCKPVPYMVFGGREPPSPQDNANAAWCALGMELGFDGMTVQPVEVRMSPISQPRPPNEPPTAPLRGSGQAQEGRPGKEEKAMKRKPECMECKVWRKCPFMPGSEGCLVRREQGGK